MGKRPGLKQLRYRRRSQSPEWPLGSPEPMLRSPESMLGSPEWALTLPGTAAHVSGIGAHVRPERALTFGRNTHQGEPRQKPLAEEPHQRLSVPGRERVERSIVREGAVGHENVTMWMPLQKIAGAGDRDHDPGPCVGSHFPPHVLAERLRAAWREIEKKLAAPPEQRTQEPWHGQHDVPVRDGLEHFFAQPFGQRGWSASSRRRDRTIDRDTSTGSSSSGDTSRTRRARSRGPRHRTGGTRAARARRPDAAGRALWRSARGTHGGTPRCAARRGGTEATPEAASAGTPAHRSPRQPTCRRERPARIRNNCPVCGGDRSLDRSASRQVRRRRAHWQNAGSHGHRDDL